MPEPIDNVPYEAILETLQPLIGAISGFVDEVEGALNARAGLPAADSRMMNDIANEKPFVDGLLMEQPIESISMIASLSCFAGLDCLRSLTRLVTTGPPPPVFSADVLCRSSIDVSRPAWWLAATGLTTGQRIQRQCAETLYSANEMTKIRADAGVVARGIAGRRRIEDYCAVQGWIVGSDTNVVRIADQTRPTVRNLLEAEFGDADAAQATWSHLSAVTHGTLHGLIQSIDTESIDGNVGIAGTSNTKLGTRMELAATVVKAATQRYVAYMGWTTEEMGTRMARLSEEITNRAVSRRDGSSPSDR